MYKDLTYQTFGRLFVICPTGADKNGHKKWWCHCECGEFVEVLGTHLLKGRTRSCGCLARETHSLRAKETKWNTTHGDRVNKNSPYGTWHSMRTRCYNPNHEAHKYYHDKGITVCDAWMDYPTFKLWAILHGWHKGLTLDRIDSSKGYAPDNCEWVTREENTRRAMNA